MKARKYASAALAALALAAPATAEGADPQEFLDHAANWTAAHGFPVGHAPLRVIDDPAESDAAYPWADHAPHASSGRDGVVFYSGSAGSMRLLSARYGRRGRIGWGEVNAAQVALHELLHRLGLADYYNDREREREVAGHDMAWWEEAAAESVAVDLLPEFLRDLYGHRVTPANADLAGSDSYAERMRTVRQLSTFATSSRNYRARGARVWRAVLVRSSYQRRAEMIEAAYAARDEATR